MMIYRELGGTGIAVSEVGFGGEHLEGKESAIVERTVHAALDAGINLFDVFMSEPNVRTNIGRGLAGRRDRAVVQGHFRAVWKDGQYGRTLDLAETKFFFQDLLDRLGTDYIDIGMIHMVDNKADFDAIFNGEIYRYVLELKRKGVIRAIGLSSHISSIALEAVNRGLIDVLMFSLNPAYDLLHQEAIEELIQIDGTAFESAEIRGVSRARSELYRACDAKGVGIVVMKGLGAGLLLDAKRSPFGVAMTVPQCIHYALTRPAVSSIVVGVQTPEEVAAAVRYESLPERERDYSHIFAAEPRFNPKGHCMYCNHCLPCVAHIDIAQVNRYLDLAEAEGTVPPTVRAHYDSLAHKAAECVSCGACEKRCPFDVPVMARMKQAKAQFGA